MTPDYFLVTGAQKNVGDYLIGHRGRQLLEGVRPDRSLRELSRFEPLPDARELNAARAIILLGGPAYAEDFYPGIYPLPLASVQIPVITLALGWCGRPMGNPSGFRFSPESIQALQKIQTRFPLSARDVITEQVLRQQNLENVVMTGCTVWHHPPSRGQAFRVPDPVRRVVVSVGARRKLYLQNLRLLRLVRRLLPEAELHCTFHRGIGADEHTPRATGLMNRGLAVAASALGFRVADVSYDVANIAFYEDCDLHIGYRVHAHLYFLGLRKPSFLLCEDGRGLGVRASLQSPDVSALEPDALASLESNVREVLSGDVAAFGETADALDAAWPDMREFLLSLP